MLLKRNILEAATLISCGGALFCILLHYITNISPITGIWFPLYVITLFIVSLCVSIKFIQWLLRLNKPLKYDLEGIVEEYPYLAFLSRVLPQTKRKASAEYKEYDTNELSVISTVLERKLVSSWYMPYISQEIGFPFACKQMLDQMIGKTFQICNKIETKDVYVDITTIITSHLKEFKKAQKRHEKSPSTPIESLYKKSHPIFDGTKKLEPADYCTKILRIIFKELVPWELWDTPHSELLVRILSKKLDNFIDTTLTDPAWLNDKLLTILKAKPVATEKPEPVLVDKESPEVKPPITTIETALSTVITKTTAPILQRGINEELNIDTVEKFEPIIEESPVMIADPVDVKSSPVLRQRRGRQGRNEVKIYDRIIEGSIKTWETDVDLQCISLGQDLLASLDGEITLSRLWGHDADPEGSPNPPRSKSPQPLWFGEEDAIDLDPTDTSPQKEHKKEHSPKPTDMLLKDIQSTVSQAKTKIGDLQVEPKLVHVPRKPNSSDEAAGMMEGLLDFGIAGLKKGLRFTGLSDDSQDKSPSHHTQKPSDKTPPSEGSRPKPIMEHKEMPISSTIQRDETYAPPLLKQQRVISQDSVPVPGKLGRAEWAGGVVPDSPEPEYEEAADLSTSIAKLRCLLQQRADASPRAEEVWWESAEETRGRTQQHHSSRPVDTATLADEYDMNMDRNASPGQSSNNMQRLDRLFQRTVTGVFNSLKTAVGAEDELQPPQAHRWTYVYTSMELSVGGAVARLVGSRRAFSHVEAALDPLDQLPPPSEAREGSPDDFEEWCAVRGGGWCALSGAAAAAGLGGAHAAQRLAALLLADLAESLIDMWLEELSAWLRNQVFVVFEQMARQDASGADQPTLADVDVDATCAALMDKMPSLLSVFGEDTVASAVRLTVSSFMHKSVNKDIAFRVLDIFAAHFKKSAALRNPSFDSN